MTRYLPLIVKNVWRNRRRTILTTLSIAASLCLLGVLMAIYHAFYFSDVPPSQALRLVTRNRVSLAFTMPASYAQKIAQVPGVKEVMRTQWFNGIYKDSRDPNNFFARFAVEPEKLFRIRQELVIPEEQKAAFLRERSACIIGRPLAEKLGLKLGDRITLIGDIFPGTWDMTIRGIYDAPENNQILYFHYAYLEESLPAGRRDQAGTFSILAASAEDVPKVAQAIDEMFRNATVQTKTESERAFALSFVSFLGDVKLILLTICGAVTFTILLVSANTVAMSVRERTREVGIFKTLGYTRGQVMGIVMAEAVAVALLGGLIGLLLAHFSCELVRNGPAFNDDLRRLTIQPPVAVACLLAAAFIGMLSSLIPAWNAARVSIIDAIRTTG